uniref:Uncharacterized protein n=1 Tax=Romanomermis culicivorax TaxID=13658 RepID=A0A915JTL4_ROMCU
MTKVSYSLKIPSSKSHNDMQLLAIAKDSIWRHLSLILSIISLILIISVIIYLYKNGKIDRDDVDDKYLYQKVLSKLSESMVIVNSITAIIMDPKNSTDPVNHGSSTTSNYQTSTVGTSPTTTSNVIVENSTVQEEKEAKKHDETLVIDKSWIQKTVSSIQQFFQSWF